MRAFAYFYGISLAEKSAVSIKSKVKVNYFNDEREKTILLFNFMYFMYKNMIYFMQ